MNYNEFIFFLLFHRHTGGLYRKVFHTKIANYTAMTV